MDTHDTNPENPKRLLLRHGLYQNFRVNGTAWTFSGTIGVDPCGDESCDLVEIARVKFMEALAAHDRPPAIQYLTVHCDISPLVLSSSSGEVTKVPVRGFLQPATTSWNSRWEHWLPDRISTTSIKYPRRDSNLYPRSEPQNASPSLSISFISSDSRGIENILRRLELDESLVVSSGSKGSNSTGRASGSTTAKKALISLCQKAAQPACWTRPCGISI